MYSNIPLAFHFLCLILMNSSLVEWPSCSPPCSQHSCDKFLSLLSQFILHCPQDRSSGCSATRHSHHWALENSLWKRKIGNPQAPNYSDLQSLPSRFNAWPLQTFPLWRSFQAVAMVTVSHKHARRPLPWSTLWSSNRMPVSQSGTWMLMSLPSVISGCLFGDIKFLVSPKYIKH